MDQGISNCEVKLHVLHFRCQLDEALNQDPSMWEFSVTKAKRPSSQGSSLSYSHAGLVRLHQGQQFGNKRQFAQF